MNGAAPVVRVELCLEGFGRARDVQLEGTAYFHVAMAPKRPFRVHAGEAVKRVLGTRFVVRAYLEEAVVQVAVAEGRVALHAHAAREAPVVRRGALGRHTQRDSGVPRRTRSS